MFGTESNVINARKVKKKWGVHVRITEIAIGLVGSWGESIVSVFRTVQKTFQELRSKTALHHLYKQLK